ncbi:NRDE domain containing protein [Elaphomyces granulatus]
MCIAVISTAHPAYSLIIINNRDEFLRRPTTSVDWWPEPSSHVLGSRDMARAERGTWMGVTKQGRIAILTNWNEQTNHEAVGACSRGAIVNSFLTMPPESTKSTGQFVDEMIATSMAKNVGGFSLVCGKVNEPLAILSNRAVNVDGITWIAQQKGETIGLSNTTLGDRSWPKIIKGEQLVNDAMRAHVETEEDEEDLIHQLLDILNLDTLPRLKEGESQESYIKLLRNSIFVPLIGGQGHDRNTMHDKTVDKNQQVDQLAYYLQGPYGTQKQTVVLVSTSGRIRYFERTLFDDDTKPIPIGEGDRSFEFMVEQ